MIGKRWAGIPAIVIACMIPRKEVPHRSRDQSIDRLARADPWSMAARSDLCAFTNRIRRGLSPFATRLFTTILAIKSRNPYLST
jgi:hypothetical protein